MCVAKRERGTPAPETIEMRRYNMKQRILSVLLALTMLLSLMPAAVFAVEGEEQQGETCIFDEEFFTNEQMLEMYLGYYDLDTSLFALPELEGNQAALYTALKNQVAALVASDSTMTSTEFDVSDKNITYTGDKTTVDANIKADLQVAIAYLVIEHPGDFYWWGRSYSWGYSISGSDHTISTINLSVAKDYSKNKTHGEYEVDRSKLDAANKAIENAQAIVDDVV